MVNAGDIFIRKLPDGRYAAVRVLRTRPASSLVVTTPYLARKRPALNDPMLRKVVIQRRFEARGSAARCWLDGLPPKCFELLGNLPLSRAEKNVRCDVFGDRWTRSDGDDALLEWRWLKDRRALAAEARAEQEQEEAAFARRRRTPQKPKKMMSEREFWGIIELLDWKCRGDDEQVLAPAIQALASRARREIGWFEERLAFLLYQLDTKAHAGNDSDDPADPNYVSADDFLYMRCAAVAKGRRFYDRVLKRPRTILKDAEFAALLDLASKAYELKTGKEFEYASGCNYESFSNSRGWGKSEGSKT